MPAKRIYRKKKEIEVIKDIENKSITLILEKEKELSPPPPAVACSKIKLLLDKNRRFFNG
jgi:hypothetical protein